MNILKNIEFGRLVDQFKRLKEGISDWIVAIDTKQYDMKKHLEELEVRLSDLESELKQLRFHNG